LFPNDSVVLEKLDEDNIRVYLFRWGEPQTALG
jgi:hypothetical protein